MTIAIGILVSDGVIIAADREESYGDLKSDTGKISASVKLVHPFGQLAVTGAGSGPHLDEVGELLREAHRASPAFTTVDAVKSMLRKSHRDYYRETVLPIPLRERPSYHLLIGWCSPFGKCLWSTSGLAFDTIHDYGAVGTGDAVAMGLLGTLYDNIPAKYAAMLAAYVVYQTKVSVKDCGLGTDIIILRRDGVYESISSVIVRQWEDVFRYYVNMERNAFHYCIGVETEQANLYRTKLGKEPLATQLDNLRAAFARIESPKSAEKRGE